MFDAMKRRLEKALLNSGRLLFSREELVAFFLGTVGMRQWLSAAGAIIDSLDDIVWGAGYRECAGKFYKDPTVLQLERLTWNSRHAIVTALGQ